MAQPEKLLLIGAILAPSQKCSSKQAPQQNSRSPLQDGTSIISVWALLTSALPSFLVNRPNSFAFKSSNKVTIVINCLSARVYLFFCAPCQNSSTFLKKHFISLKSGLPGFLLFLFFLTSSVGWLKREYKIYSNRQFIFRVLRESQHKYQK